MLRRWHALYLGYLEPPCFSVAASITPIRVCGSLLATMGMAIGPTIRRPTMAPHTTATMALSMAAPPNTAIRRLLAATKVLRSPQGRCKASRSRRSPDSLKRSSHHLPAEDRLF